MKLGLHSLTPNHIGVDCVDPIYASSGGAFSNRLIGEGGKRNLIMRKIRLNAAFWKDLNFWLGFMLIALFVQSFFPITFSWVTRTLLFIIAIILLLLSITKDDHSK